MPAWLFGLAITLLVGMTATAYFWLIRRRNDETAAGLLALAGMRWRDFSRLVLDAMHHRGLRKFDVDKENPQEQSSSFVLTRGSERWLLSCKHGSAYRIGSVSVDEFASEVRLTGMKGGILVTQGFLDQSGRDRALKHNIEVLDGDRLWPEVKPMVDAQMSGRIVGNAAARARRYIGLAWLGAVVLGVATALAILGTGRGNAPVAVAAAADAVKPPGNSRAAAAPEPVTPPREPTEAELDAQRDTVSKALSRTAVVSRGVWITRSTLSVDRIAPEKEVMLTVCGQLERYANLRTSRVQLNPPLGSDEPVRWRQCKTL